MTPNDVHNEIRNIMDQCIAENRAMPMSWLAQHLLTKHPILPGADEFHVLCIHRQARNFVREAMRGVKLHPETEEDRQYVLPGYQYVQRAYPVVRDEEPQMIPVHILTDDELDEKCAELQRMGDGCYAHRDELQRYKTDRENANNLSVPA